MRKIGFIVGHALGHIGRSLMVARALRASADVDIVFFSRDPNGYLRRFVSTEGFRIVVLDKEPRNPPPDVCADRLESALQVEALDVLVMDLSPVPWLMLVRLPQIPQIYITNCFLTKLNSQQTFQDNLFYSRSKWWNQLREIRGMPELRSPRDLYERDLVILADPELLIPVDASLPLHYKCVGQISWEPDVELPAELVDIDNILYISLGSTGIPVPNKLIEKLKHIIGVSTVVQAGTRPAGIEYPSYWKIYSNLPGRALAKRSSLVITQGGAGSSYQALDCGVPVCCWPAHLNHALLASRIEAMSVGLLLEQNSWKSKLERLENEWDKMRFSAKKFAGDGADNTALNAAHEILNVANT